jgi:hypothetical protein
LGVDSVTAPPKYYQRYIPLVKTTHILNATINPQRRRYLFWIVAIISVVLFYKTPLSVRLNSLAEPYSFNGDALQHIAPLWFVHQPVASVSDYTQRYYLEAILPVGFRSLYGLITVWLTPPQASKLLSLILSLLFIALSTDTSQRLAGRISALLTLFLACGGVLKNLYFAGAIQRSFGFFLAALAVNLACRYRGTPVYIVVSLVSIVAATFYPALAPLLLIFLGLILFFPTDNPSAAIRSPISKRLLILVVSALFVGVAVLPQIRGGKSYGERLSLRSAEALFEEWGPDGRYTPGDRGVPVNLFSRALSTLNSALSARRVGKPNDIKDSGVSFIRGNFDSRISVFLGVFIISLAAVLRRGSIKFTYQAAVLAYFFLASLIAFYLATLTFPLMYIPSRYIALGLIPLAAVVFPALCSFSVRALVGERRLTPLYVLAYGGALILLLGWGGLTVKRVPDLSGHAKLFHFIERLPSNAVLASWPRGIASALPLFTGRSVVINEEGHQIFHRDVLEEMRRRTRSIIAVYSATDAAPIRELRERYHVSHLVINRRHLHEVPQYFEPFGREIRLAREGVKGRELYLASLIAKRTVFRDRDYLVVEIGDKIS